MPRVIHFEIPADDPQRAISFYEKVFGWKIEKYPAMDYWLCNTGPESEPGIHGAITMRSSIAATANTISVQSVDEFSQKIAEAGGKVLMPKTPIPGVGYFAYCNDSEGNLIGIMQPDESAK